MTDGIRTGRLVAPESVAILDLGDAGPYAIAFGAVGDMWVTLVNTGELLRRSADDSEHRFRVGERPGQLGVAQGGTWCAVTGEDRVALVTTDDRVSFIEVPGGPYGVVVAGDEVWTTLMEGNGVALIGPDGVRDRLTFPVEGAFPAMVAVHDDGSIWTSLNQGHALARTDPSGDLELIELPEGAAPVGVAAGGDFVWTADIARGSILRVDRRRQITEFPLTPESRPHALIADANRCWFTEWGANRLGRISADGQLTEFDLSGFGDEPHGLALDRDRILWIAFESGEVVGFDPPGDGAPR